MRIVYQICLLALCFSFTLKAQCTFTVSAPYFESFGGISSNNQLPICWNSNNLGTACLTYTSPQTMGRVARTGNQFASFSSSVSGSNYFFSNGIQLNTGITYSMSVWFVTEYFGYNNWSDLSLFIGPNQSNSGLVQVASTNTTAVSNIYKSLSNTFTVASSGIYYAAIRATSSSSIGAQYLTFDDFAIDTTCTLPFNISASSSTLCSGQQVTLTANGAHTYTWDNGSQTAATTYTLFSYSTLSNVSISVLGTNSLTGCSLPQSIHVVVYPTPTVSIFSQTTAICKGSSLNLYAVGAATYSWSNLMQGPYITVSPTISSVFSATGTSGFGCSDIGSLQITVIENPVLQISQALGTSILCKGEKDTLIANGAAFYVWSVGSTTVQGSKLGIAPTGPSIYTLTGTTLGCSSSASYTVNVRLCNGLEQAVEEDWSVRVAPNPFHDLCIIYTGNTLPKEISIQDVTGRLVLNELSLEENVHVRTEHFLNGVYVVKLRSGSKSTVIKVIKN